MEIIATDRIEKICTKMWNMSEQEAFKLSFRMEQEQPSLVSYLTIVDRDYLNQSEREMLFYLGTVIWQIMSDSKRQPAIKEETLLNCEKENLKLAESLKLADNIKFAGVIKSILNNCEQPEVFRYVVAALLEEEDDESPIRDQSLGIIMLDLKTVIDSFNRMQVS
jgi:hypothetical protein